MSNGMLECEQRIEALTQEYAFFLNFHSGVGNILAGCVFGAIYLVNWLIGSSVVVAVLTISLTMGWIFANKLIWSHYYDTLGKPIDRLAKFFRFWRIAAIGYFTLLAAGKVISRILDGTILQPDSWLSLLLLCALPIIMRRYLRSPIEILSGFILFLVCAVASEGRLRETLSTDAQFFLLFGLSLIMYGAWEHGNYRRLVKQFAEV